MIEDYNYFGDPRVIAGNANLGITKDGERIEFTTEDNEGNEVSHTLPTKFEVCGTCGGRGSHVNPSIDCGGLSSDDFDEDPDFRDAYFNGSYDN